VSLIIGLVLAAFVLVFFEVILPGGILGLLAVVCIIAATWLGFSDFGLYGGGITLLASPKNSRGLNKNSDFAG